jgi:hypothetical protein
MYSDMSRRTSARSSSNRKSASARAVSVFPGRAQEDERPGGPVGIAQAGAAPPHGVRDGGYRLLLADHAATQLPLEPGEPLALALQHLGHGNPGPLGHDLGDVLGVHLLLEVARLRLHLVQAGLVGPEPPLQLGDAAVAELRRALEITPAGSLVDLVPEPFELGLDLLDLLDGALLGLPLRLHSGAPLLQLGDLLLHGLPPLPPGLVLFLEQRLPLDLELDDPPLDLVDLLRQAVDLDAEPAGGFVHQVDRLVGQEAVADIPVGQGRGGDQRVVGDAHAVVDLVLLLEAPENRDGVRHARLAHQDRLEAALQRGVLFDVLAVLVQGRGPDDVQLAPGQRRLEHVARVHRPLGGSGPDDGVQLVDEGDVPALALGQLLHHGLEPLLELTPVLGAGQQLTDVQRHQLAVAKRLGHVAVHDALGQTLHDGGLPDARLADQHRVVLGPPRQHLHHAADLLVPADHRVELSGPRLRRQVPGVPLQRLVLALGRLIGHPVRAPDVREGLPQRIDADPLRAQQCPGGGVLLVGEREQQMLGRDVLVAQGLGLLLRAIEDPVDLAAQGRLRASALLGGKAADLALGGLRQGRHIQAGLLQQRLHHALGLAEQREQQMGVVDDGVAAASGVLARVAKRLLGLDGQSLWSNHRLLMGLGDTTPGTA